ncbi:MAG: RIO1 family regulatory kinase/ATPase [Thermomicrobiales bacterium]
MPRTASRSPRRPRFDDDIDFPQDDFSADSRAALDTTWDDEAGPNPDAHGLPIPQDFFDDGWITEVEHVVSSGKEGTVYACLAGDQAPAGHDRLAVKIYTPRDVRSFHNDSRYIAGRQGHGKPDQRMQRAMAKKTRAGLRGKENSWINHGFITLQALHAAGASVPEPFRQSGRAVLMEFVGDADGPAPRLKEVAIAPEDGRRHFRFIMEQIELWLGCGVIHGDLSPFNILVHRGEIVVIDFPQAVDPWTNPDALDFLERDIANVARHFAPAGVAVDPLSLARSMWYEHRSRYR